MESGDLELEMNLEDSISIGEFVSKLIELLPSGNAAGKQPKAAEALSLSQLLRYGHFRLWLEDSDESHPQAPLNRQTAARIIHEFLRIEKHIPELTDISPALALKDLYSCRVCANHIAQVYSRGIMSAKNKGEPALSDSPVLLFNHLAAVTKTEAENILIKCGQLILNNKPAGTVN